MKNKNENEDNGNRNNNEATPRLVLPFMGTMGDAYELCRLEQDDFYMSAFMIQAWIGRASVLVAAEYAEKKEARTRYLQYGHQSPRAFAEIIGDALSKTKAKDDGGGEPGVSASSADAARADEIVRDQFIGQLVMLDATKARTFFQHILRFSSFDDPIAGICREAVMNFATEVNLKPQAVIEPPFIMHPRFGDPRVALIYFCDWLDSVLHLKTHAMWYSQPAMFDPNAEKRDLAAGAFLRQHMADADAETRSRYQAQFEAAAKHYPDSPKQRAMAVTLDDDKPRVWTYEDVDTAVITLWPLVKRFNWTYVDLLKTIRPSVKRPKLYPCHREQSFATYCTNVLGLRKTGKGKSSEGELPGAGVARRLLGLTKNKFS
jgi:hypothetical protein